MAIVNTGGNKPLPSTSSATNGDVLTLDSNLSPIWQAPSGGGTKQWVVHYLSTIDAIKNYFENDALPGDIVGLYVSNNESSTSLKRVGFNGTVSIASINGTYMYGSTYYVSTGGTNYYNCRGEVAYTSAKTISCYYFASGTSTGTGFATNFGTNVSFAPKAITAQETNFYMRYE